MRCHDDPAMREQGIRAKASAQDRMKRNGKKAATAGYFGERVEQRIERQKQSKE